MFSFQELDELKFNPLSDEEEREIYNSLEKLGQKLFEIFSNIKFDTCYKLTPNAKNFQHFFIISNRLQFTGILYRFQDLKPTYIPQFNKYSSIWHAVHTKEHTHAD